MNSLTLEIPPRVDEAFRLARIFSTTEKVLLAKLLLDSVVSPDEAFDADWQRLGLAAFEQDWDNPDDAIFDNWRALYGAQEG